MLIENTGASDPAIPVGNPIQPAQRFVLVPIVDQ
jgi:hypothetical protein